MQSAPPSTRIFIGKLGTVTKQELFRECSSYGNILDFLMKDQYAFVVSQHHPEEYSNVNEAEKAIIDLDGKYFSGQRIIAEFAKPKSMVSLLQLPTKCTSTTTLESMLADSTGQ
jgi:RNA recognition motif-containing protein